MVRSLEDDLAPFHSKALDLTPLMLIHPTKAATAITTKHQHRAPISSATHQAQNHYSYNAPRHFQLKHLLNLIFRLDKAAFEGVGPSMAAGDSE